MVIFVIILAVAVLMFIVGVCCNVGRDEINGNIASTFGMLTLMVIIIACLISKGVDEAFKLICGGIPIVNVIADYGSLQMAIKNSPLAVAAAFLDIVLVSAIMDLGGLVPIFNTKIKGKKSPIMTRILWSILLAVIAFILVNYLIKLTPVFKFFMAFLGLIFSIITFTTIVAEIWALLKKHWFAGIAIGAAGGFLMYRFAKSKPVKLIRSAFFKSVVLLLSLLVIEYFLGDITTGVVTFVIAFMPAVIAMIGIGLTIKSVFWPIKR